jgi:hypothetical protein
MGLGVAEPLAAPESSLRDGTRAASFSIRSSYSQFVVSQFVVTTLPLRCAGGFVLNCTRASFIFIFARRGPQHALAASAYVVTH